ncbi:SusC/RagA family TonB-linked outer membrane protein [Chryseolinea soli]|uniref:TonB-dependent receptor n=1 Tax=Chryseolinea soli TaxID=2321403 RepID=A0A385SE93_9BACT|nr:TonB-dependent receptor [Chryseolinea soli]AYB30013.1 TonB-dependent receptor [Chryseolinea soli]
MKIILRIMALLVLCSIPAWAQSVVTGKVTSTGGEPLPGVSVLLKGTSTGSLTDADGNYTINATEGTLVFSFIGYKPVEALIGGRTTVDVSMEDDVTTLEQIVVVGYGTQEKKDITGAVGVVDQKAMASRPNTQFGNLIQGKAAGVQVIVPSGKPSAGFSIRVRGATSISGNNEPLYVVDGVPSSDTRTLNPADIESISVLKDASSAAIYGAQGANGVVLITTKRGKTGTPKVDFNAYTGFSSAWRKLKVLNSEQYRDLMTEFGQTTDWSQYTANTDWQNEIFQNGRSQNYQLGISGKTDKTNYYISGGWMQQIGSVRSSEMDRYNFKVNLEQKMNDWLTVGTNLNYMRYHDVDVSDNLNVNSGGVILGMLSTPPNIGIFRPNGTYSANPFQDWENPVAGTDGSDRNYKNQRLLGNVYAEINFLPDLKFRSNVGTDYQMGMNDYFLNPFMTSYGRAKKGIGRNEVNLTNYYIIDNTLSYKKTIDQHNFSALVGSVIQKYRWENNKIEKTGYSSASVPTTNAGSTITEATNDKSEKSNASFIGRVTYDYAGRYLLTANFRADGSSSFGPNKRFGYFPSVSVGWRISEESFFQGVQAVSDLKLRAGWGVVGNDQGGYAYIGRVASGANYPIGGVIQPGTYPESIQNNDLKWESTEQTNLGLDFSILNSRVQFSADAYLKNTSGLLLNVPLPKSTGFDSGLQNVGKVQNKGLEFQVLSHNLVGDLTWDTDFNISFNRNKVIYTQGQQIVGGGVAGRGDGSYTVEGKPMAMFYGYVAGGVDPATGNAYYIDKNGESTFTPSADDRTFIGNPNPNFYYGMTNTLGYKNFGLSIFLQGTQGNDILNATRIETEGMTDAKNQSQAVAHRWRAPGDVTDIPKASWGSTDNSRLSTRFVEDGSYMRVKAVTLSYNVPSTVLSRVKMSNLKVYVTGENLFTFTNYKGYDPEVSAFGNDSNNQTKNIALGIDYGTFPQTRNLIFGVNVSF